MRFVHTADWQIGMAAHVGGAAERVRRVRLESARRVVSVAREHQVDFIVLAGDTFEHNAVSRETVVEVAQILSNAHCPVFVIPGNHDPLQPGSVWENPCWRSAWNVRVLTARKPVEIHEGVLYPCALFRKRSDEDPMAWIAPETSDVIRVAVAHGTVGDIGDESGARIPFDAAERSQLDYVALGHWHSTTQFDEAGVVRVAYSGTHETSKFGEKDSGNVLLVEIEGPGSAPRVTTIRTGHLTWHQVAETITGPNAISDVKLRLERLTDPRDCLVEVTLSGLLFESDLASVAELRQCAERFLFCRFDDSALRPAPEDDAWFESLPAGVMREVATRLRALACGPDQGAEVATQALRELYALQAEVRP